MDYETLDVRQEGDALWVTLNRPDQLNAMSRKLVAEVRGLFTELYWRSDVRVVALTGAGRAFCAGLDLKSPGPSAEPTTERTFIGQRVISEINIPMRRSPQPIVALVNGAASGAGFALALASDVRVATPAARM